MRLRPLSFFFLMVGFAIPAIAEDAQDHPQATPDAKVQKKENSPEPEAHGTRLEWKDLPKNILRDQKAIWMSPLSNG